jgi:hypothetical protein
MRLKNTCIVLALVALFVHLNVVGAFRVQAQYCPTPPSPGGTTSPPQYIGYTYYLQGMDPYPLLRPGVRDAFSMWSERNLTHNCSAIGFFENTGAPPAVQGDYDILCYTANPIPGVPATAAGFTSCVNSNPLGCGGNFWRVKCKQWLKYPSNEQLSSQGNYFTSFPTAVRKLMAHEIGHVMGLGDQPQPYVQYASIMNGGIGTNDTGSTNPPVSSGGNLPWNPPEPTACDHAGIQCYTCPTPTPTPVCINMIVYSDIMLINNCWYLWNVWQRFCDGVLVLEWSEYVLFYCEPE